MTDAWFIEYGNITSAISDAIQSIEIRLVIDDQFQRVAKNREESEIARVATFSPGEQLTFEHHIFNNLRVLNGYS